MLQAEREELRKAKEKEENEKLQLESQFSSSPLSSDQESESELPLSDIKKNILIASPATGKSVNKSSKMSPNANVNNNNHEPAKSSNTSSCLSDEKSVDDRTGKSKIKSSPAVDSITVSQGWFCVAALSNVIVLWLYIVIIFSVMPIKANIQFVLLEPFGQARGEKALQYLTP